MASGPMQQMLDATLVSAADEAPTKALRLDPELEDMADSPLIQRLPIAKPVRRNRDSTDISDVISFSDNSVVGKGSAKKGVFFRLPYMTTV